MQYIFASFRMAKGRPRLHWPFSSVRTPFLHNGPLCPLHPRVRRSPQHFRLFCVYFYFAEFPKYIFILFSVLFAISAAAIFFFAAHRVDSRFVIVNLIPNLNSDSFISRDLSAHMKWVRGNKSNFNKFTATNW